MWKYLRYTLGMWFVLLAVLSSTALHANPNRKQKAKSTGDWIEFANMANEAMLTIFKIPADILTYKDNNEYQALVIDQAAVVADITVDYTNFISASAGKAVSSYLFPCPVIKVGCLQIGTFDNFAQYVNSIRTDNPFASNDADSIRKIAKSFTKFLAGYPFSNPNPQQKLIDQVNTFTEQLIALPEVYFAATKLTGQAQIDAFAVAYENANNLLLTAGLMGRYSGALEVNE